MSTTYQVVDCRREGKKTTIVARTPEEAAELVLGERLVRSGQAPLLRAKVYFQGSEALTLVRLYSFSPLFQAHRPEGDARRS